MSAIKNTLQFGATAPAGPCRWRESTDFCDFSVFLEKNQARIRRAVAVRLGYQVGDLAGIDDLLEEAFRRVWQGLARDCQEGILTQGCLRNMLVELAMNLIAAADRTPALRGSDRSAESQQQEGPHDGPHDGPAVRNQILQVWDHYVLWLPERDREILDMVDNLGMSYHDVARELVISRDSAGRRYRWARKKLRELVIRALERERDATA